MVKFLDKILTLKGLICTYIILIFFSLGLYWVSSVYPNARNILKGPLSYIDFNSSNRALHPASNSNELEKKRELPEQKKESALKEEVVTEGNIEMAEQYNKIAEHYEKNVFNNQNFSNVILPNDLPASEKSNVTNNHEAQVADNLYKQADPVVYLNEETAETVQVESPGLIKIL
jgi:hypothetical protein